MKPIRRRTSTTLLEERPVRAADESKPLDRVESGLRPLGPDVWCRSCGAIHEEQHCVGDVLATGAERHAWRGVFETPSGRREVHGVLVAPAACHWRARILTFPRMLWTFPGTTTTLKFVHDHPREAERRAIEYIEEHCERLGQRYRPTEEALIIVGAFDAEAGESQRREPRRRLRSLPIRFGSDAPKHEARTVDVSERGLFIATAAQFTRGTRLRLLLEIGPCRMPLHGVVSWTRDIAEPGRPCGLGVAIHGAPALYVNYVRGLP